MGLRYVKRLGKFIKLALNSMYLSISVTRLDVTLLTISVLMVNSIVLLMFLWKYTTANFLPVMLVTHGGEVYHGK